MKGKALKWITLFFTFIYPLTGFSQLSQTNTLIKDWVSQDIFKHTSIGIYMQDAKTGKEVASYNSQRSLTPASIQKLLTTAAALEMMGPDYRFSTNLGYNGKIKNDTLVGNLIILGGGDPALGSMYFEDHYLKQSFLSAWTDSLASYHIRCIKGDIITDATIYDDQDIPDSWVWEDLGNYYGAGTSGLTVYDNLFEIHFSSPSSAGQQTKIIAIAPEIPDLKFDNRVLSSDTLQDLSYVFGSPLDTRRIIRGTIPKGKANFIVKASVPDPAFLLARQFREIIKANGISVTGEIKKKEKTHGQEAVTILATTYSPPLTDIIRVTNYESVNLFAEHLLKHISYLHSGLGNTREGTKLVVDFWKSKGIDTSGLFMCDGSGLSRFNAVTPRQMVAVLNYMKNKSPNSELFFRSLPAAPNGTLFYFNPANFPNEGLRAKSGSMTRVRSFAGILKTTSDREILFTVMLNNFSCSQHSAVSAIEKLLINVSKY